MKKSLLRFISLVLVMALILPTLAELMPTYVAFAAGNTIEGEDEATKEAKEDSNEVVIKAGDWHQAHYIHSRAVRRCCPSCSAERLRVWICRIFPNCKRNP